ncbi:MAG: hypothetical protein Aurels2KO_20710 [Aureliella sp.]
MLKKFVALLFAGFMAVSFVGCAAETADTGDDAAATSTDEGADEAGEEEMEDEG